MLDERIYLHDLRVRTLSVRPRGWKDFPPAGAKTVPHAVAMTVAGFFREHPLADLTVFTVIHLLAVVVWHVFTSPYRLASRLLAPAKQPTMTVPVIPLIAAPARATRSPHPTARAPLRLAWHLPPGWQRSVIGFACISLLVALPFGAVGSLAELKNDKDMILDDSVGAVRLLTSAGEAAKQRDFAAANRDFSAAATKFTDARERLGVVGTLLSAVTKIVPINSPVTAADPMFTAGREIAAAGTIITEGFSAMDQGAGPVEKIRALRERLSASLPHVDAAVAAVGKVSPKAVPEGYRTAFETARGDLPRLARSLHEAETIAGILPSILGAEGTKRYLVVFQNNAELRPTGGFIGSFALLDVRRGELASVEIPGGGSYDLKGGLRAKLVSPRPLHLINPHWQFQDSNWSPDFPTAAQTMRWFYEKSGGPTTDGVVAITATLMERLLEITGPIEMPEYGKTIDAANFYFETQKEVEIDYDRAENKPKKFIGDLAPRVLERLLKADESAYVRLIDLLDAALEEKHLMVWFADAGIQSKAGEFGWTGALKGTDGDYLAVVHTNIGGQKTDLAMKESIDHAVKVLPDGGAIVTLTISRTHTGTKGALFSGVRNVDYLRIFVPLGSTLVEASGFRAPDPKLFKLPDPSYGADPTIKAQEDGVRIDRASGTRTTEESGKTVFGNWMQIDPGETGVATVVYRLPPGTVKQAAARREGRLSALYEKLVGEERERLSYSLLVQKQPGALPSAFTSRIDLPRGFDLSWGSDTRSEDDRGRLIMNASLDKDLFTAALLQGR
jgi:hypothetical protein